MIDSKFPGVTLTWARNSVVLEARSVNMDLSGAGVEACLLIPGKPTRTLHAWLVNATATSSTYAYQPTLEDVEAASGYPAGCSVEVRIFDATGPELVEKSAVFVES